MEAVAMSSMRRDDDNLGYLKGTLEALIRRVDEGFEEAKKHRCAVRQDLAEISNKVDPLVNDVRTLQLQHTAMQADISIVVASRADYQAVLKFAKGFFRWFLPIGGAIAIFYDQVKTPFQKLLSLFRLG